MPIESEDVSIEYLYRYQCVPPMPDSIELLNSYELYTIHSSCTSYQIIEETPKGYWITHSYEFSNSRPTKKFPAGNIKFVRKGSGNDMLILLGLRH